METNTQKLPSTKKGSNGTITVKSLFAQDNVKKKFQELLGNKMQGFVTSVLQCVANNELLAKADPNSVYHAASIAAVLDLPINPNLGFAYIIPFNDKKSGKCIAQFSVGYKGFIQLAQRSGQFKTIAASPIYEGQIKESNPLTGYKFDFTKKTSDKIIGYAGYFKLLNGFEKTIYHTCEELKAHGLKYSQSFKKGMGLWKDDFDAMATKTVIKTILSKYAPLSIEMQKAVIADIEEETAADFEYVDTNEALKAEVDSQDELNELYELFALKKENLTEQERKDAEHILNKKEVSLFKNLKEFLKSK